MDVPWRFHCSLLWFLHRIQWFAFLWCQVTNIADTVRQRRPSGSGSFASGKVACNELTGPMRTIPNWFAPTTWWKHGFGGSWLNRVFHTFLSPATLSSYSWKVLQCSQARWEIQSLQRVLGLLRGLLHWLLSWWQSSGSASKLRMFSGRIFQDVPHGVFKAEPSHPPGTTTARIRLLCLSWRGLRVGTYMNLWIESFAFRLSIFHRLRYTATEQQMLMKEL